MCGGYRLCVAANLRTATAIQWQMCSRSESNRKKRTLLNGIDTLFNYRQLRNSSTRTDRKIGFVSMHSSIPDAVRAAVMCSPIDYILAHTWAAWDRGGEAAQRRERGRIDWLHQKSSVRDAKFINSNFRALPSRVERERIQCTCA